MRIDVKSRATDIERDTTPTGRDQNAETAHNSLRELLRPLIFIFALVGCCTYDTGVIRTGKETRKRKLYLIYRAFVLLVLLLAVVKGCMRFFTISSYFHPFSVIVLSWYIQCSLTFIIFSKSYHVKYGYQRKTFEFWEDKIRPELEDLQIEFPEDKIKLRLKIYLSISVFWLMSNITVTAVLAANTFSDSLGVFFAAPLDQSAGAVVITCFISSLMTILWILPIIYITYISIVLKLTFEALNTFLEKHILQNSYGLSSRFQKIRQLHLNLSKMVFYLDKDFGCYFASAIITKVGISVFTLYVITIVTMGTFNIMVALFWQISSLVLLAVVTVSAAFVNEAAHGALDTVFNIHLKDTSMEQLAQLNLFLSKLTGTQVGFTTLGLLTITKEFLLTLAGVLLTYFFILYTL